jgi:hypothetical protein
MAALEFVLRAAALAAVVGMSAWVAHICLRRRPDAVTAIINLSFWIVPVSALAAATGQFWKSFALGTALVFVLQRLHWLKWKYLADTLTVIDFRMVMNRANWLVLHLYPYIAVFIVLCVAGLALSWIFMPDVEALEWPARVAALLVAALLVAFDIRFRHRHEFDPFGFNSYGHFANLLFSASSLKYQPPRVKGDGRLFRERAATLPHRTIRRGSRPPDIVVWLQESATDPRVFDVPGASLPALRMHEPDAWTRERGWLRVPTWGGSTWLSEFALLTGLSHRDFGAAGQGVYYTVTPHLRYSLPRLLRSHGYRSVVLFPVEKSFYNAESAYNDLGFDEVLNPLDFPEWQNKSLATTVVEDQDLITYALKILSRTSTEPLFLFMLSMIQHGPYDASHEVSHGLERSALDRATAGRVSEWLSRMERLSLDTVAFEEQLQRSGRETVFAYFGDHQPNFQGVVPLTPLLEEPRFLTRYTIKGNGGGVDIAAAGPEQGLDLCFLGARLLDHAGLPANELFTANAAMRQLCGGTLVGCRDNALVESYRAHLYHDLQAAKLSNAPELTNEPAHMGSLPSLATRRRPKAGT